MGLFLNICSRTRLILVTYILDVRIISYFICLLLIGLMVRVILFWSLSLFVFWSIKLVSVRYVGGNPRLFLCPFCISLLAPFSIGFYLTLQKHPRDIWSCSQNFKDSHSILQVLQAFKPSNILQVIPPLKITDSNNRWRNLQTLLKSMQGPLLYILHPFIFILLIQITWWSKYTTCIDSRYPTIVRRTRTIILHLCNSPF